MATQTTPGLQSDVEYRTSCGVVLTRKVFPAATDIPLPVRPFFPMDTPSPPPLCIRTKTWIENGEGELLFGKGKTEILELIEQEGSIAKAAENLGMNYKKTWTHIKILQKNIADQLVIPQKGGGGSGGTTLTPKARELVRNYRQLQREIEEFANRRFAELFLQEND